MRGHVWQTLGARPRTSAIGDSHTPTNKHSPITVGDLWRLQEEEVMKTLDMVDQGSFRDDIPDFRAGDNLKVYVKVVEGNKTRVQMFQGVVIGRSGSGIGETFTVRKVSYGVGVERTFPLHTPIIEKIEVASRGDVRRAKLYYLRGLRGKKAKIRELRDTPKSDD